MFQNSLNPLDFIYVDVLLVLTAIMIINFMLIRHPWLSYAINYMKEVIIEDIDRGFYLVSVISFFASQIIMNDGLCLMLVHPVLDAFAKKNRNAAVGLQGSSKERRSGNQDEEANQLAASNDGEQEEFIGRGEDIGDHEAFYFMLNIACSANIGSVLTFAGNPQNLIIAQFLSRYMNCAIYYFYMIIPATITWILTIGLINYLRKKESTKFQSKKQQSGNQSSRRTLSSSGQPKRRIDIEGDLSMSSISRVGQNVTIDGSELDEDREIKTKSEWTAVGQNDGKSFLYRLFSSFSLMCLVLR
jgi:di/tricarboxylate transporter